VQESTRHESALIRLPEGVDPDGVSRRPKAWLLDKQEGDGKPYSDFAETHRPLRNSHVRFVIIAISLSSVRLSRAN
jgi:hypothetical protein